MYKRTTLKYKRSKNTVVVEDVATMYGFHPQTGSTNDTIDLNLHFNLYKDWGGLRGATSHTTWYVNIQQSVNTGHLER